MYACFALSTGARVMVDATMLERILDLEICPLYYASAHKFFESSH